MVKGRQTSGRSRKDERRRIIVKTAMMLMIGVVLLIIAVLGWFVVGKKATGSGMSVTATKMPFEIATSGTSGVRNENELRTVASQYSSGDLETIDGTGYYVTGQTTDSLQLRYSVGDSEIGPGGNGDLSLYVIPKTDESLNVTVSLNIIAYAELEKYTTRTDSQTGETVYELVYKTDDNGFVLDDFGNKIADTELVEITSLSDFTAKATNLNNQQAVNDAAEYITAAKYLRGHIVFFGGLGDTTNNTESARYYYTTPYMTRIINKSIASGNEDEAIQVPIYWMWTNTLGQLALPDDVSGKRSGYPVLADSDTDKSDIISYLSTNRDEIFANNGNSTLSNIAAVSTHVATVSDFDTTAFNNLSSGYNEADRLIGTRIAYFVIEVTVEEA